MESRGKSYTIVGAGRSGVAAALLARSVSGRVFLSESGPEDKFEAARRQLEEAGIPAEFGGHSARALDDCDCLISSPGVPPQASIFGEAARRGIPVIGELEFAWRHLANPCIAITGTNGKTTTVSLLTSMLKRAGRQAVAAGNIGRPLSSLVGAIDPDTIIVLELSSYQLDRIDRFRPDVAVILNIAPDHLAYHGSFDRYCEAKSRIFSNQTAENVLILNADDPTTAACSRQARASVQYFAAGPVEDGMFLHQGRLFFSNVQQQEEELMDAERIRMPGIHNVYNSMAASLAARVFELSNEDIRDSLMSFAGVEHRLEPVREWRGVEYVNDSKATNTNATWYALGSFNKPIVWIAGGRGDNNDYSGLDDLVRRHVQCVITIGEESRAIFNHFSSLIRCIEAASMSEAVRLSSEMAEDGDVVLFSPACKSFDMFANFEMRGLAFKNEVSEL